MRWILVLVFAVGLVACGGDDGPSEEETAVRDAMQQLLTQVESDQYADAWDTLHPSQQEVITREHLIDCGERYPVNWESFEVDDPDQREWTQEAIGTVDAWVIDATFQANEAYQEESGTDGVVTRPFQWVTVDGDWRWFVRSGELATFADGGCGVPWAVFSASD